MGVQIVREPIDANAVLARMADPRHGALAAFWGVVRNHHGGRAVARIDYHCYEPMALKELSALADEVARKYDLPALAVVHRIGVVPVGEASLLVVAADAHRRPVISAIGELIDELKRRVPIWKKEYGPGGECWVEGQVPGAPVPEPGDSGGTSRGDPGRPMERL